MIKVKVVKTLSELGEVRDRMTIVVVVVILKALTEKQKSSATMF